MNVHFSSETDLWSTPQATFDKLHEEFGFALDVCAIPENAKCPRFFSPEQDGLKQEARDLLDEPAVWPGNSPLDA